jgi:hypothetical protein
MSKMRRVYQPRLVGDKVMMPADLKRLHKYMLEIEHISEILIPASITCARVRR